MVKLDKETIRKNVRNKKIISVIDLLYLIACISLILATSFLITALTKKASILFILSVSLMILYVIDRFAELMQYRQKYPNDKFGALP